MGISVRESFWSLYLLSPGGMAPARGRVNPRREAINDPEEVGKADFFTKAMFAWAAAWSRNPKNPPLFLDLPFKNGEVQAHIVAKWHANAPLAMVDQYVSSLRQYRAIAMDAGTKDQPIAGTVATLHDVLTGYGIEHTYETYEGDHVNRAAERLGKKVLPFFAGTLQ